MASYDYFASRVYDGLHGRRNGCGGRKASIEPPRFTDVRISYRTVASLGKRAPRSHINTVAHASKGFRYCYVRNEVGRWFSAYAETRKVYPSCSASLQP